MNHRFPVLSRVIHSNLYRTLVVIGLLLVMIWSLNEPFLIGWLALLLLGGWVVLRLIQRAAVPRFPLLMLGLVYGLYLSLPKGSETTIPAYYFATAVYWMVFIYILLVTDTTGGYLQRLHWENGLIFVGLFAIALTLREAGAWYLELVNWKNSLGVAFPILNYRTSGTITNHANNLAALLNAIWPLLLWRLVSSRRLLTRTFSSIGILAAMLCLYLTNSRGGILATLAMICVLLVMGLLFRYPQMLRHPRDMWSRIRGREKMIGVVVLSAAVLAASLIFWRAAFTGVQKMGFGSRSQIWEYSWIAFKNSPWFGNGAGTFVREYALAARLPNGWVAPHAHNLELQSLVISGIFGILFLVAALVLLVWSVVTNYRILPKQQRLHLLLICVIFIGMLVHHQFDYALEGSTTNLVTYAILLALLLNFGRSYTPTTPGRIWLPLVLLVAVLLSWSLFQLGKVAQERQIYEQTIRQTEYGDWNSAYPAVCELAHSSTINQFYGFQCSYFLSLAAQQNNNPELIAQALQFQSAALHVNPWWPIHRANYAGLLWSTGQFEQALQEIRTAADSVRNNSTIYLNYGLIADALGASREAENAYFSAMLHSALLTGNPLLANSAAGQKARSRLQETVFTLDDWQSFRTGVRENPYQSEREWAIWRIFAAEGLGELNLANELLDQLLKNNPGGVAEQTAAAYLADRSGNLDTALQYADSALQAMQIIEISSGQESTSWFHYYLVGHVYLRAGLYSKANRVLQTSFIKALSASKTSSDYNRYVYLNSMPFMDLIPTLEWGLLTPAMEADFVWLATELRAEEPGLADHIEIWLELQRQPKITPP